MTSAIALRSAALTLGYRHGRRARIVARDLTVELAAGEFAALIGPNGAGKSTLLRTLTGMQPPLVGQVFMPAHDGAWVDLHALPPRERAQRIAVVLTERIDAAALSGYDVIALGRTPYTDWLGRLSAADHAAVAWAIDAVDAGDLVDQPFAELSDGQRQRVLIARALAQQPAVIVLDEPTAFLDITRRIELTRLLRDLAHSTGRAVLASTHDLDLAAHMADRLWVLHNGQITTGTPRDLLSDGTVARALPGALELWPTDREDAVNRAAPSRSSAVSGAAPAAPP